MEVPMLKIYSSKRNKIWSSSQLECVHQFGIGKRNTGQVSFDKRRWSEELQVVQPCSEKAGLKIEQSHEEGDRCFYINLVSCNLAILAY